MLRDMITADHLPDYTMAEEPGDIIRFTNRAQVLEAGAGQGLQLPPLASATHDAARATSPPVGISMRWRLIGAPIGRRLAGQRLRAR